jgi:hypothetical protein
LEVLEMNVRIVRNPRRYPHHAVVMAFSRFEPAMQERVALDTVSHWVRLLRRTADALGAPWNLFWERLKPGVWGLPRDEYEFYGLPPEPDLQPVAQAVRQCFADAGVDVEVHVVT